MRPVSNPIVGIPPALEAGITDDFVIKAAVEAA